MKNDAGSFSKHTEIVFRKRDARARRYEINAAMQYRAWGEKQWREGVVENISISGALIRTTYFLELETAIEMKFPLPVQLRSESSAEVFCRGSVVRSSKCKESDEFSRAGLRIDHWRFLRRNGNKDESPKHLSGIRLLKFE
jgi:hypothetical protein